MNIDKKKKESIKIIKQHEPKDGYYVGFSGGKDSIVLADLIKQSGVKYKLYHAFTTVDYPEIIRFIKKYYPQIIFQKPKYSMYQLIKNNKMLPTMITRYCCRYLKEYVGKDKSIVLGIRKEESNKRNNRIVYEYIKKDNKTIILPILDWLEWEIWDYIDSNKLDYPKIYDTESRVGCIGCPMGGKKQRIRQFNQYPKFKKMYIRAIKEGIKKGGYNKFTSRGLNENNIFDWWLSGESITNYLQLIKQQELVF